MLPHIILVLLVVCNVGICVFCPFSFVLFHVSFLLLWAPLQAAYNNLIDSIPVISCTCRHSSVALVGISRENTIPIYLALIVLVVLGTIPVSSANRGLILFGL